MHYNCHATDHMNISMHDIFSMVSNIQGTLGYRWNYKVMKKEGIQYTLIAMLFMLSEHVHSLSESHSQKISTIQQG